MHREQVGVRLVLALGAALFLGNLGSKGCEPEKPSAGAPSEGGSAHAASAPVKAEGEPNAAPVPALVPVPAADGGNCKIVKTAPFACTKEYKPVCGCDHRTYGNACEGSAVSSLLHEGMCSETDCKSAGGHVVFGAGPAPMCEPSEESLGSVQLDGGQMAVEGSICCASTKK